jgi:hypothetical protein
MFLAGTSIASILGTAYAGDGKLDIALDYVLVALVTGVVASMFVIVAVFYLVGKFGPMLRS